MASTYSTSLKIQLIGNGEQSGAWGTTTNTNWNLIEQAVAGVQAITMANANYTLSNLNGVSDEARNMVLVVNGTNSAIRQVVAPLVPKFFVVTNNTVGGYAITIGGATGSIVTIPNGVTAQVYCDGTNFYSAQTSSAGNFLVNGSLTVSGSTTANAVSGTTITASTQFTGPGTGLTGTAASLSIGGSAGSAGSVTNAITFNTTGGAAAGTTYNGSAARTIDYSTVGAPSATGTGASGTWSISVSGNAGTVTNGVYTTGTYANPTWITSLAASKLTGQVVVANGGTGVATLSGLAYGNGTSAFSAATAAQVVAVIGTTAVANATSAGSATSAANLTTTNFTVKELGGKLVFQYGGVTVASMSSTGAITSADSVTGGGTP